MLKKLLNVRIKFCKTDIFYLFSCGFRFAINNSEMTDWSFFSRLNLSHFKSYLKLSSANKSKKKKSSGTAGTKRVNISDISFQENEAKLQ